MNVKPEISNKVADSVFTFSGATVSSPIIDTRTLDSTVLIKSGDTLAIGGLLQDEIVKTHNKVPVLGDIPGLVMPSRNISTPAPSATSSFLSRRPSSSKAMAPASKIRSYGLHHSGEEYADPNGWRNNASGAYRLVPTSHRQVAADYPKPGVPRQPDRADVDYRASAADSGNWQGLSRGLRAIIGFYC